MARIFVFGFLLIAHLSFAQSGNYFLSHYAPEDERFDNFTFAIAQDDHGVFHFANKLGIIEFDGRNWGLIPTSGPIFTVTLSGHEIFAGGFSGFGKVSIGPDHVKTFQSLSQDQKEAGQIFSSLSLNGKVYFANAKSIFILSPASGKVESVIHAKPNEELIGLLDITGKPFVKSNKGIYLVDGDKLSSPHFPWSDDLSIEMSANSSFGAEALTLLSVTGGRVFLASISGLKEINADREFLARNTPVALAWVNERLVAIGTLRGGVIFIDPQTGATQEITSFYTGLPDNEIYSMFTDRNEGLWVAHSYGFSRIAPSVPFRSFSYYRGIQGNMLCVKTFKGQTYVGTTLGLFRLSKTEETQEVANDRTLISEDNTSKKRKGLFSFLKRNKMVEVKSTGPKKALKGVAYVFKKIEGIEGKVTQLVETDGELLAAGNFGVASINEFKSTPLVQAATRFIFKSTTLNQLFVSTLDDNIRTLSPGAKGWKETHLLDTLTDYISFIFEDKLENIWLCGQTNAIKIETVDKVVTSIEQVPFLNPTIDESVGMAYGSEVYVATGGSFHRYDIKDNVFKKYDSLPGPKKYFASAGYFWFHDGHRWRTVDPRMQSALKLKWLGMFSNLRYIAPAENSQSLWLITSNNELFRFSSKDADESIKDYPLFLREVRGQQNRFKPARSIVISQLESTVSFDFIQPDYLGMRAVEYRYQVKSKNSEWTPWATSNNIVNFSYLPSGLYKLEVQTRDMMGKESAIEEISLEVEPPYWRRAWFYLLEVIFFGSMVFLSIRLGGSNSKYRLISRILSMLTIIMIIQLVQSAVNTQVTFKTTPVLDFFVQVGLALLVLPVERYLRKLMVRGV
ncbi:MAG TPA: triple tyrosine motif-containing protein [Cyclobacteriaceae bacterium]|nr:triple tyrosine motif-containing protein [Cyclobacteriaceae bacterium]